MPPKASINPELCIRFKLGKTTVFIPASSAKAKLCDLATEFLSAVASSKLSIGLEDEDLDLISESRKQAAFFKERKNGWVRLADENTLEQLNLKHMDVVGVSLHNEGDEIEEPQIISADSVDV